MGLIKVGRSSSLWVETLWVELTPGQVVLGCMRKSGEQSMRKKEAHKQYSPMSSASVPAFRVLAQAPASTSLRGGL